MRKVKKKIEILRTSEKNIVMAKIRDYQRIARAYDDLDQHERAAESLMYGLKEAKTYAEENNSYKGPLVYSALVNWFSHGIIYPQGTQKPFETPCC